MTNLNNKVLQSCKKLEKANIIVHYRRVNWVFVRKTALEIFWGFTDACSNNNFPYLFRVVEHTEHPNENSIEIKCVVHPNTKLQKLNNVEGENPNVFEKGGTLVLTQTFTGHILFIFYPLLTEKVEPIRKEILISNLVEPNKIDSVFFNKILYKFMLLIRDTSLHGSETLTSYERCKVLLIFFNDIRYKHKLIRSVIFMRSEWAKLALTAIISVLITYYLAKP